MKASATDDRMFSVHPLLYKGRVLWYDEVIREDTCPIGLPQRLMDG